MDAARLARVAAGQPDATDLNFSGVELAEPDARNTVIDAVARGASRGSRRCLDELLALIDEHRLDRTSIRRLIVDDHDADDVHQDVLIAVACSISSFRSESSFNTWLYTVARNTAATHLRRRRDTQPLGDDDLPTAAARLSSIIASRTTLEAAVNALPDHYRVAVVMRDIEQLPYGEIAARLNININTVKSRLSRGRALAAQGLRDAELGLVSG